MPSIMNPIQRVRHESKLRLLQVQAAHRVTSKVMRVTLSGEELDGFVSSAYDDHVKLFFPGRLSQTAHPSETVSNGPVFPDGTPTLAARDYTPRRYDTSSNTLEIDFALHCDGPASRWAEQATYGQFLGVGGPRSSFVVPYTFDWYLLVGDETALPAIGRRLAELPPATRAIVVAEVTSAEEEQQFSTDAELEITWLHRKNAEAGTTHLLLDAISSLRTPSGSGFSWVAAESSIARALRRYLVDQHGFGKESVKAAGYWRRGSSAIHDRHED
jgi:NADPH-dependent ferric siderophore reductase